MNGNDLIKKIDYSIVIKKNVRNRNFFIKQFKQQLISFSENCTVIINRVNRNLKHKR